MFRFVLNRDILAFSNISEMLPYMLRWNRINILNYLAFGPARVQMKDATDGGRIKSKLPEIIFKCKFLNMAQKGSRAHS